ncbi:MAG: DNA mismatch endonuclease patch repair, partial [Desulfobulbaceae bacterium]
HAVSTRCSMPDSQALGAHFKMLTVLMCRSSINYKPKSPKLGRSTIDIAFPGKRIAIFIDGCFWHNCPEHGEMPKANNKWWRNKFAENAARDERVTKILKEGGWRVQRFWAHETPENVCQLIQDEIEKLNC